MWLTCRIGTGAALVSKGSSLPSALPANNDMGADAASHMTSMAAAEDLLGSRILPLSPMTDVAGMDDNSAARQRREKKQSIFLWFCC